MDAASIVQWVQLGFKVVEGGAEVLGSIKESLAAKGIDADLSALDALIADATAQKKEVDDELAAGQKS